MRVRAIELLKNFGDPLIRRNQDGTVIPLAEYRTFGFYDALDYTKKYNLNCLDKRSLWHISAKCSMENVSRYYNTRCLLGFINSDEADDEFWNMARRSPVLFVTLVRMNQERDNSLFSILNHEKNPFLSRKSITYLTGIHSELLFVTCGDSFSECKQKTVNLLANNNALKLYTIFSVRESELEHPCKIVDENVKCRLKVTVKDPKSISSYIRILSNELGISVEAQWSIGKSDLVIDIAEIPMHKLLPLYRPDCLLTHSGYQSYFYNIETKIHIAGDANDYI